MINRVLYRSEISDIPALNLLKLICAFMVVGIHIDFILNPYVKFLYRIAVPVFYIISGYFIVDQTGKLSMLRLKKTVVKVVKLIVISNLVYYAFFALVSHRFSYPLLPTIIEGKTICGALWYLNSYLECLLVMILLVRLNKENLLLLLSVIGFVLNLVFGAYSWAFFDTVPKIEYSGIRFALERNFLTMAFPCVCAGVIIRNYERAFSNKILCRYSVLFLFLMITERILLGDIHGESDVLFFTIPLSIIVFLLFSRFEINRSVFCRLADIGKCISSEIYLYHLLIAEIVWLIIAVVNIDFLSESKYWEYWFYPSLLVVIVALLYGKNMLKRQFFRSGKCADM